jgi:hypothetical protein
MTRTLLYPRVAEFGGEQVPHADLHIASESLTWRAMQTNGNGVASDVKL